MKELTKTELIEINGGSLQDDMMKGVRDAGQYVSGFLYGLFAGECPSVC